MAKYAPLSSHLKAESASSLTLSFADIEKIIGAGLPDSARARREWWWNDADPRSTHVQCRAWVHSGYLVKDVDLAQGWVTFKKVDSPRWP